MTPAKEAGYYDKVFSTSAKYAAHPTKTPYVKLWARAIELLDNPPLIVDLGCGPGQFAQMLCESGYDGIYIGFDFSPVAIEKARKRVAGERCYFATQDLRTARLGNRSAVFLCLETLEHLDDDLELLRKIPVGAKVIFSVPNFGDAAHVRKFDNEQAIQERYGDLMTFHTEIITPPFNSASVIFLSEGTRT